MKYQEIRGLNLPGTPWATSACRGRNLLHFMYITRLASNVIFSPSNKIYREVGRANDLPGLFVKQANYSSYIVMLSFMLASSYI